MSRLFKSFDDALIPIVGQQPTKQEMAADLALEMCERIKELRAEAMRREEACEPPMEATPEQAECYATLDALMKGPHAWVVKPVVLEQCPELVRPPTDAEKQAVEQYIKEQDAAKAN